MAVSADADQNSDGTISDSERMGLPFSGPNAARDATLVYKLLRFTATLFVKTTGLVEVICPEWRNPQYCTAGESTYTYSDIQFFFTERSPPQLNDVFVTINSAKDSLKFRHLASFTGPRAKNHTRIKDRDVAKVAIPALKQVEQSQGDFR